MNLKKQKNQTKKMSIHVYIYTHMYVSSTYINSISDDLFRHSTNAIHHHDDRC